MFGTKFSVYLFCVQRKDPEADTCSQHAANAPSEVPSVVPNSCNMHGDFLKTEKCAEVKPLDGASLSVGSHVMLSSVSTCTESRWNATAL